MIKVVEREGCSVSMDAEYVKVGSLLLYQNIAPKLLPGETCARVSHEMRDHLIRLINHGDLDEAMAKITVMRIQGEI